MLMFLESIGEDENEFFRPIDHAYINGYAVDDEHDSLLEGITFRLTIVNNRITAKVIEDSEDYFQKLNENYWIPKIIEYAYKNDTFSSTENLEDDYVVLYDTTKFKEQQTFECTTFPPNIVYGQQD